MKIWLLKRFKLTFHSIIHHWVLCFTHKAGIHAKAILANPSTYEILSPSDFGLTRYIHFANRLTGWNAIKSRVDQLNLHLTDEQCKEVTNKIKKLGDVRQLNIDDVIQSSKISMLICQHHF